MNSPSITFISGTKTPMHFPGTTMTFTTTLFKVLENAPDTIIGDDVIGYYQIKEIKWPFDGNSRRCICDQDNEWTFKDQEVIVGEDGKFKAIAIDLDDDNKEYEVNVTCTAPRPICKEDIPD